jgi:hypothetical protein
MKAPTVALGLLIASCGPCMAAPAAHPNLGGDAGPKHAAVIAQQSAIRAVIAEFEGAIVRKDRARFLSLFLDPNRTSWQGVAGDGVAAMQRAKNPSFVKVKIDPNSTPASFFDFVASQTAAIDETFDNIRISGDADVAAVLADYKFKFDGQVENTGTELWSLVRTDQGWRITSVNWSTETLRP